MQVLYRNFEAFSMRCDLQIFVSMQFRCSFFWAEFNLKTLRWVVRSCPRIIYIPPLFTSELKNLFNAYLLMEIQNYYKFLPLISLTTLFGSRGLGVGLCVCLCVSVWVRLPFIPTAKAAKKLYLCRFYWFCNHFMIFSNFCHTC